MKRFCCLAALMLLSSSAYAGHSFSFALGGHRIRVEAPRHCYSRSCLSVSIPGILARRSRDRTDEVNATPDPVPAKPPAPEAAQVSPRPAAPPASKPFVEPVTSVAPAATVGLAAAVVKEATAPPPPPQVQPAQLPRVEPAPIEPPRIETPAEPARPIADAAPKLSRVSREADDQPLDTPLGDWQTEGKGAVRIERCGAALCGYVLDLASDAKREAVLVNMRPKTGAQWSGNVYSHNSGDSYYGTLAMKGPNSLRVEACALGKFYCSGNIWSRIDFRPDRLISSRQTSPAPRS
jgi:uncharacterized protein (DUF2147 family)